MEEKKIFQEIPRGKNKFHSAILTSFSFSFHHFEYQVLKSLKQKWISNIGLLVDSRMLDKSIGIESAGLKQVSQSYSVNGINSQGAFHPKINFIIGDDEVLMIFGSGNITAGGHGKNHETFTSLFADNKESNLIPLIQEGWSYIEYLSKELQGYSKDRIFNLIPKNCILLKSKGVSKHKFHKIDEETEIALVYNDTTSIISQIINLLPVNSIKKIEIVSPFYDEDGSLLVQLLLEFPNATLEVYVPKENGLAPIKMPNNNRVTFYSWEETPRGKKAISGKNQYNRKLHSKIFNFKSEDNWFFMIGSANATIPAFGTINKRGVNEEFGAIYKSNKTNYFKELNISKSIIINNINILSRSDIRGEDSKNNSEGKPKLKILSCDLINLKINIYVKDKINNSDTKAVIFNEFGMPLIVNENVIVVDDKIQILIKSDDLKSNPVYVLLQNNLGEDISNKQLINFLDKLYNTDPSKENRTIRGILNDLEIGKINEFQILDYINNLRPSSKDIKVIETQKDGNGNVYRISSDQAEKFEMTYEQAIEAAKNKESGAKIAQTYGVIQIWGMISKLLRDESEKKTEEINDEEELASAIEGAKRTVYISKDKNIKEIKTNAEADKLITKTKQIVADYIKSLDKISRDKFNSINEISLCQFLVISKVLTVILNFTEYKFPTKKENQIRDDKLYTPDKWKKITKSYYAILMKEMLIPFAKLFITNNTELIEDDEMREMKLKEYSNSMICDLTIYLSLIYQSVNEKQLQQTLDLTYINIIDNLNSSLNGFDEHIKLLSESSVGTYFSVTKVISIKKRLLEEYKNLEKKDNYFRHPQLGICSILEKDLNKIVFKSLFNDNDKLSISIKEFNKL